MVILEFEPCGDSLVAQMVKNLSVVQETWVQSLGWEDPLGNEMANNSSILTLGSVQSFSCVQLFATPWTAARQAPLSITNSRSPPKPMFIKSVMPSNHLILCCPLLLPPIPPSIKVFSNESALLIRWSKYWGFSFSISPSNEHPGLISFRMGWLDPLVVQGTLKTLLQHHSSTLTSIHDHWKNHSLDQMDFCWQSNVSAFEYAV